MDTIIFTHCGKLGDFVYSWPVAAWYHRTHGRKVHWVLPQSFKPFQKVVGLLMLQEFTAAVTLVDFHVRVFGCGGQPYRFDPSHFRMGGEYRNLGLRSFPDKFVSEYIAEEHGFSWDPDWVLNVGTPAPTLEQSALYTEQSIFPANAPKIDLAKDVLTNVRLMAGAEERHCAFSAMAVILYFARLPFTLHRANQDGTVANYFPDRSRFHLRQASKQGSSLWRGLAAKMEERLITKWLLMEGN